MVQVSLESPIGKNGLTAAGDGIARYRESNNLSKPADPSMNPAALNAEGRRVAHEIMNSPDRTNSFVKADDGSTIVEFWAEDLNAGILATKTGQFIEFTGRLPVGKDATTLLPPARAGPELSPRIQLNRQGRIDYSADFLNEKINFEPGFYHFKGKLEQELVLVQYHRDTILGNKRSAKYWTPVEQANAFKTISEVTEKSALLPEWGDRNVVSVARIPKGAEVEFLSGKAIRQQSLDGKWYSGHGDQIRFKDFDPLWIKETRKIPK
jgi:hypothetical protein